MQEQFRPQSAGDLEAVILAESYDLLSSVVGPYMYRVSGLPGEQQAVFASSEMQALFYIRAHEFMADATDLSSSPAVPSTMSLLSGGRWISQRHLQQARRTGLHQAYERAHEWFGLGLAGVRRGRDDGFSCAGFPSGRGEKVRDKNETNDPQRKAAKSAANPDSRLK